MKWKQIIDCFWFVTIFVFGIALIENQGSTWLIETAGDLFGAVGLMALAVYKTIESDDDC